VSREFSQLERNPVELIEIQPNLLVVKSQLHAIWDKFCRFGEIRFTVYAEQTKLTESDFLVKFKFPSFRKYIFPSQKGAKNRTLYFELFFQKKKSWFETQFHAFR
jgi:hypothetical protein